MSQPLNILLLPHPVRESLFHPWGEDVMAAIGGRHRLKVYDPAEDLARQFEGVEVVIDQSGSAGTREMADLAAARCRLWQILGTGIDSFDLDYWRSRNIPVANTPGPFSGVALAECAMMFILMLTRKYPETQTHMQQRAFYEPVGLELVGLKLGIVGFGASGCELARRAGPFGLKILAADIREITGEEVRRFGLEFAGKAEDIDRVVADADILSVHLPLNPETRHIIDERRLDLMKPSAFLINVARGALVDEQALSRALVEGRIAGAGLDVFGKEPPDPEDPIFKLPTVVTTPHIAGVTDGTSRKRARVAADNADRVAAGLEPLYRVDL